MNEPVYVTGLSAMAANGSDTDSYWRATLAGESGLRPLSRFDATTYPVRIGGEIRDLPIEEHVEGRLVAQTDRWTQLALIAGDRALADAGIDPAQVPAYEMAVVTASSSGGNEFGQREIEQLWRRGPGYVGPYQSIAWFYAATTGQLSIRHGMQGQCGVVVTEQAGGLDSIGQARRVLRQGASVVLTGGTEAPIGPYAITCQVSSGLLDPTTDQDSAYLPFDAHARGYVPGEGGAILVLESEARVRARRPERVYGVVAGFAQGFAPTSDSRSVLRRVINQSLGDARLYPEEIDVVFADACAHPDCDAQEVDVLVDLFGPYRVPVTAPKSMVGRLYAGGASLDVATALLAIRDGVIPPTRTRTIDPRYQIDLVTQARPARIRTALVVARGHGGFVSALVVRAAGNDNGTETPE